MNLAYWRNSTVPQTLLYNTETSEEPCPSPARYYHLADTVTEFSKGYFTVYQSSCFRLLEKMIRQVNSMSMGPFTTFFCCEKKPLIRSNTVYSIMTEDKAFCKSTNSSFGRSNACREGKSISWLYVYSNKNKISPLPSWKLSSVINLLACWSFWETVPCQELSISLCCWQMEYSAVGIARKFLESRSPHCWAHA